LARRFGFVGWPIPLPSPARRAFHFGAGDGGLRSPSLARTNAARFRSAVICFSIVTRTSSAVMFFSRRGVTLTPQFVGGVRKINQLVLTDRRCESVWFQVHMPITARMPVMVNWTIHRSDRYFK